MQELLDRGYPAYTTSVGWLGYPDEKIRSLCREAIAQGFSAFKMKVGRSVEDDVRRAGLIREEIGGERSLMMDANQVWDVDQAIAHMEPFSPASSPDGSRSRRTRTTSSATRRSRAQSPRLASRPASTATTG